MQWDHAIGNDDTGDGDFIPNGDDDAIGYNDLLTDSRLANHVAQNSWKPSWFFGPTFDPTLDATYNIYLDAHKNTVDNTFIARTDIQIIVGNGGSPVPDSGSAALLLSAGLLGLLGARRFARRS